MSDLFWVSQSQLARIAPNFRLSHGIARVDDHGVVSGIIHVIRNGFALARWAARVWTAQDLVQPLCTMESHRGF